MEWTAAPDRLTGPAVGVLALAVGSLGLLAAHDVLWNHAGSAAALDANEAISLLAWVLGWCLLVCAALAAAMWLSALVRVALAQRRMSVANASVFVVCAVVMTCAVTAAPLWGAGGSAGGF